MQAGSTNGAQGVSGNGHGAGTPKPNVVQIFVTEMAKQLGSPIVSTQGNKVRVSADLKIERAELKGIYEGALQQYRNHYGDTEGPVQLKKDLANSADAIVDKLNLKPAVQAVVKTALRLVAAAPASTPAP